MEIGDLVIRKVPEPGSGRRASALRQRRELGHGLVLSRRISGNPGHWCVSVYYPKVEKTYEIAESLMEKICGTG